MKPLNSGHLRFFKNLSVIKRCPLLGCSLTKTIQGMSAICYVRYWGYYCNSNTGKKQTINFPWIPKIGLTMEMEMEMEREKFEFRIAF